MVGDILAGRPVDLHDLPRLRRGRPPLGHRAPRRARRAARPRPPDRPDRRAPARDAPRPYRLVVLSDHGQSQGETFLDRYGETLEELVRAACDAESIDRRRRGGGDDALAYLSAGLTEVARDDTAAARTVRAATRGRRADGAVALDADAREDIEEAHGDEIPELSVMASGLPRPDHASRASPAGSRSSGSKRSTRR